MLFLSLLLILNFGKDCREDLVRLSPQTSLTQSTDPALSSSLGRLSALHSCRLTAFPLCSSSSLWGEMARNAM
jgi:hypothetical protein